MLANPTQPANWPEGDLAVAGLPVTSGRVAVRRRNLDDAGEACSPVTNYRASPQSLDVCILICSGNQVLVFDALNIDNKRVLTWFAWIIFVRAERVIRARA